MYANFTNKLAKNSDIEKVVGRLKKRHIDPLDDFGPTETIIKIDLALDNRQDTLDYFEGDLDYEQKHDDSFDNDSDSKPYYRLISELKDQISTMKDWKKKGVKWVYIDDDLYVMTDGKPCLVYTNNLDDENRWITEYLKRNKIA